MSRWLITIGWILGSAFLTRLIPFSSFFRNVDTMIHEFGHAAATLMLSGRVLSMELNPDHSGVTYSTVAASWNIIPIAMAGYVTSSLFSLLMFYLYSRRNHKLGLLLITSIALATLFLFVHQGFGVRWLTGFILLTGVICFLGQGIQKFYYLLLCFLTLEESVLGPVTIAVYAYLQPGEAGDASNLGMHTGIPGLVWALFFAVFALWCAKKALGFFFRRGRAGRTYEYETRHG